MRLFQNSAAYPSYLSLIRRKMRAAANYAGRMAIYLDDRFGASHILQPVLDADPTAALAIANDQETQRLWAREHGLPGVATAADILLAQIEEHRTEVFYNLDPVRFPSAFVARLPGCVRTTVAWRAAPTPAGADFGAYDWVVCNFPAILAGYAERGWRTAHLDPAHDPVMNAYAARDDRPVDLLFTGGYSRHHLRRAEILETVAALTGGCAVELRLDLSARTRLAETPLGLIGPLRRHRLTPAIRSTARPPVFGRDLYEALSRAKVVLNVAVDMAGDERGNMRCWEAMGCGALMVSDTGRYPQGMAAGQTMITYDGPADAADVVRRMLDDGAERTRLAAAGHAMIRERYSKAAQWRAFTALVG